MTSGSRATMTRSQRRAAANREAILDAARTIIATEGAAALTLDAVAERADVAVQTIYNRVGGRPALIVAVAEQALEESRSYMDEAYDSPDDLEARIRNVTLSYLRFARERPNEFRILVEPPDQPEAVASIASLTRKQNARFAAIIREGVEQGLARPDLDPDELATVLWAAINGLLSLSWRPGELRESPESMDRLIATYVATITDGIRHPDRPAAADSTD